MQKTTNYQLNQWEPSDPIRREDFNQDNAAIDAALAANAKALSDYQTANDAAVAKKAEQSAVTALETTVAGKGNCRMAYGTYTGTGTYGSSNPNKLTFTFKPYLVICHPTTDGGDELLMMRANTIAAGYGNGGVEMSWGSKSVSWFSDSSAARQYNQKQSYSYVAFGVDE